MKRKQILIHSLLVLAFLSFTVPAWGFRNVVVFGDSLSDNGNIYSVSGGLIPPAPYADGRFSDGPVWVEYLVEDLGIKGSLFNFAHGGAKSDDGNVNSNELMTFPGMVGEVAAYLAQAPLAAQYPNAFAQPGDSLFIIWIGGNDFLEEGIDPAAVTAGVVANVSSAMDSLFEAGAREFLVVYLPDLGATPRMNTNPTLAAGGTLLSQGFNATLSAFLDTFESENAGVQISRLDPFSIINEVKENPVAFGFTNVLESKLDLENATVAEGHYLFWDGIHPTTMTHRLLAGRAMGLVTCSDCTGGRRTYLGSDLTLTVPAADLGTSSVGFTLMPYENTEDSGYFWKLDESSVVYH